MTTREKFGSFVAAIRCPNQECHDKGFTMYPEDMENNILPCLCHGCGKMFYVEIDQEESLEENLKEEDRQDETQKLENSYEDSKDSSRKKRTVQSQNSSREKKKISLEESSSNIHQSTFLSDFDDDEDADDEDDFDFEQYQKRLEKRRNRKKN